MSSPPVDLNEERQKRLNLVECSGNTTPEMALEEALRLLREGKEKATGALIILLDESVPSCVVRLSQLSYLEAMGALRIAASTLEEDWFK